MIWILLFSWSLAHPATSPAPATAAAGGFTSQAACRVAGQVHADAVRSAWSGTRLQVAWSCVSSTGGG